MTGQEPGQVPRRTTETAGEAGTLLVRRAVIGIAVTKRRLAQTLAATAKRKRRAAGSLSPRATTALVRPELPKPIPYDPTGASSRAAELHQLTKHPTEAKPALEAAVAARQAADLPVEVAELVVEPLAKGLLTPVRPFIPP